MRYPDPSTVIRTDIVLDNDWLVTWYQQGGTHGAGDITFRTVLDLSTNTLTMQVLDCGQIVGERGVYQGTAPVSAPPAQGGGNDAERDSAG